MTTSGNNLEIVSAFSMYKNQNSLNEHQEKKKKRKRSFAQKIIPAVPKKQKVERLSQQNRRMIKSEQKIRGKKEISDERNRTISQLNERKIKIRKQIQKSELVNGNSSLMYTIGDNLQSNTTTVFNELVSSDNPLLDAFQTFKWMIQPVSEEVFFKSYWEQKVLHIKRGNENYYNHIFNSIILDKIIRNNRLYYTQNVDVVCYENGVKKVYNPEGKANPSALWDYYFNGCSIRILNPQTYCNRVHLLLATLQEYFGTMVGANVYLTPPNSQGFAPHYDDIEAFVIQLEGRKHWKLYKPKGADVLARFSSPNLAHKDIGEPFMELTLNAGEVLYFPRGTIHEGFTDAESHSLHITVSTYQQTCYTDLLQHILPDALKSASENNTDFRKGLPLNYLKHLGATVSTEDSKFRSFFKQKIENLVQSLVGYIDVDAAADTLGKKFMYDSMPPVLSKVEVKRCAKGDGPFLNNGQVMNKVGIDLDTNIRLLRYYCIRVVLENNANPKIYYNTENANVYHGEEEQWLELDANMIPAVRMLQNAYPRYIAVQHLPMEDEELKLHLISDLWEHGLIVTEHPLKAIDNE